MYDFKVSYAGDWEMIITDIDRQFENEKEKAKPEKKLTVKQIIKDKKWWKIL